MHLSDKYYSEGYAQEVSLIGVHIDTDLETTTT